MPVQGITYFLMVTFRTGLLPLPLITGVLRDRERLLTRKRILQILKIMRFFPGIIQHDWLFRAALL